MARRLLLVALAGFAAVWVGLLGAGAFNPDDGWLQRSNALWELFGLTAYAGVVVVPLALLGALVLSVARCFARRAC